MANDYDREGKYEAGIERYAGDDAYVSGIFIGEKFHYTAHAHYAPCGGEFVHSHKDGRISHTHDHKPCEWCREGIRPDHEN